MFDDQTASDSAGIGTNPRNVARAMNYLVEVFLDENKHVCRTRVHHVQSAQEVMWDDWDEARLLAFFKQRPEMRLTKPPRANHIHKAESALSSATGTKTDATSNDWRTPRLYKMEIVPAQSGLPSRSFSHKQTFNVRLSLDLAEMKLGGEGSSEYSVAVTARRVGVERQQELIKDRGVITSNRNLTLDLKWPALPPGTYRISAAVTIRPKHANTESRDEMTASLAGGLYKVY